MKSITGKRGPSQEHTTELRDGPITPEPTRIKSYQIPAPPVMTTPRSQSGDRNTEDSEGIAERGVDLGLQNLPKNLQPIRSNHVDQSEVATWNKTDHMTTG